MADLALLPSILAQLRSQILQPQISGAIGQTHLVGAEDSLNPPRLSGYLADNQLTGSEDFLNTSSPPVSSNQPISLQSTPEGPPQAQPNVYTEAIKTGAQDAIRNSDAYDDVLGIAKEYVNTLKSQVDAAREQNLWRALSRFGFSLAASRNPDFLGAVGESANAGLDELDRQRREQHEATQRYLQGQLKHADILADVQRGRRQEVNDERRAAFDQQRFGFDQARLAADTEQQKELLQLRREELAARRAEAGNQTPRYLNLGADNYGRPVLFNPHSGETRTLDVQLQPKASRTVPYDEALRAATSYADTKVKALANSLGEKPPNDLSVQQYIDSEIQKQLTAIDPEYGRRFSQNANPISETATNRIRLDAQGNIIK